MVSPIVERFAPALVALLMAGCASAPVATSAVDSYLEDLSSRGIFQGAVVLGRAGKATYARGLGYADPARGIPFTVDTPSDGGSITKTFTAAAVMRLIELGQVDLDDPVVRHVPEYPHAATRVRHLLAHSAGLPDYDWFDRFAPPPLVRSNADQLRLLREQAQPPAFAPGERFAYDNAAYDTAALLVERVSGQTFPAYLQRHFLGPLGMRSSFVRPARLSDFPGDRTRGYKSAGPNAELFDAFEGEAFHGGGNLYVSAMDLHRWVSSLATQTPPAPRTAGPGLEFPRFAGGAQSRLTWLNWYRPVDEHRHYYFGHHNGFYSFAYWNRATGATAAFVSNSDVAAAMPTELPRALVAFAEGRLPAAVPLPALVEPAPGVMFGPWHIEGLGPVEIVMRDRARYLRLADGLEVRMFRRAAGLYALPGLDGWLRFHEHEGRPAVLFDSVLVVGRGSRG